MAAALLVTAWFASGDADHAGSPRSEGLWQGTLVFPGLQMRIGFRIESHEPGPRTAILIRPDEGGGEVPVDSIRLDGRELTLVVNALGARFAGEIGPADELISGVWIRGERSMPLVLRRVDAIAEPDRPQTPRPPFPYAVEEVSFQGTDPGVRFAGTLTLPCSPVPAPAVVLLSGVGGHDRDGTILGHRPLWVVADHLARRGVAALRVDDRGIGGSTGERRGATSADFADDALAAVAFLRQRAEIDPSRLGILGHSEGGTIAMLAAAKTVAPGTAPDVCENRAPAFLVVLGTPGLPGHEYQLQFEESMARAMGASDDAVADRRAFQESVLSVLEEESNDAAARARLRELYRVHMPGLPETRVDAGLDRFVSPWFRFTLAHDPAAVVRDVPCPVLALYGGHDAQVPPAGNVEAMRTALADTGVAGSEVAVLPGLNHLFQSAPDGSPRHYGALSETISPAVLDRISAWIGSVCGEP